MIGTRLCYETNFFEGNEKEKQKSNENTYKMICVICVYNYTILYHLLSRYSFIAKVIDSLNKSGSTFKKSTWSEWMLQNCFTV